MVVNVFTKKIFFSQKKFDIFSPELFLFILVLARREGRTCNSLEAKIWQKVSFWQKKMSLHILFPLKSISGNIEMQCSCTIFKLFLSSSSCLLIFSEPFFPINRRRALSSPTQRNDHSSTLSNKSSSTRVPILN